MLETQTITKVRCDICGKQLRYRRNSIRISRYSTRIDIRFEVVNCTGVPDVCHECAVYLLTQCLSEENQKEDDAL